MVVVVVGVVVAVMSFFGLIGFVPGVNLGFQDFKYGSSSSVCMEPPRKRSKTNNSTFHTAIYISPFPLLFQLLLHRYLFSDPTRLLLPFFHF
jgi:hypothetical protein